MMELAPDQHVTTELTDKRIKLVIILSYVGWAWSVLVFGIGAITETDHLAQLGFGLWALSFVTWVAAKAYRYWHHG